MNVKKAFGITLRKLRNKNKLSLEALALEAEMARSHIYYLETGQKEPKLQTLYDLCDVLEIKPSEFIKIMEKLK